MSIRLSVVSALLATALFTPAYAEGSGSGNNLALLDYQSARSRLIARSDAIHASDANVRSHEAKEGATRTLRRPTVEAEAQFIKYQKTLYLPLGPLASVAQDYDISDPLRFRMKRSSTRPIVTATLPIYTGGEIGAVQSGAKAQLAQSQAEQQITVDDVTLQMTQLYFGQQLLAQAMQVRQNVLDGLERHVSDARKLELAGFISRAQRLQAEVARDDAAREVEKAQADLANINTALSGVLRLENGVRPTTPIFIIKQTLAPIGSFQTAALEAHPQLARLHALSDQAEAGVTAQRAKQRPTLYGFAQYNFDRQDSLLTDPDWLVGVGIRYTLASGLGRSQAVTAAQQTVAQAQAGLREARNQLEIGVARSWNDTEAARRRFLLNDTAIAAAEENLRVQSIAYREQQATSLDVIDAQLSLGRAQIQRTQAAHDFVVSLAQLLHTSGQMEQMPHYIAQGDRIIQ